MWFTSLMWMVCLEIRIKKNWKQQKGTRQDIEGIFSHLAKRLHHLLVASTALSLHVSSLEVK